MLIDLESATMMVTTLIWIPVYYLANFQPDILLLPVAFCNTINEKKTKKTIVLISMHVIASSLEYGYWVKH